MIALTHVPSPNMQACERTYVPETAIDFPLAKEQHAAYCGALRACGVQVRVLNVNSRLPDCAFIEDTAIVLDEVAILCSLGTDSRRSESTAIEPVLAEYRPVVRIDQPATLEGGDVLRLGRTLLVGRSSRTNAAGIAALSNTVSRYGYTVVPITVRNCLHLKTACSALPDARLLINPAWVDEAALQGQSVIQVTPDEPWAANVALVGSTLIMPASCRRTADQIRSLGFDIQAVDLSEFAKAEGGATCLSLIFE